MLECPVDVLGSRRGALGRCELRATTARIGFAMPPKRGRAAAVAEDETAQEFRRHKSAANEAMNEFLCPITFSLPVKTLERAQKDADAE